MSRTRSRESAYHSFESLRKFEPKYNQHPQAFDHGACLIVCGEILNRNQMTKAFKVVGTTNLFNDPLDYMNYRIVSKSSNKHAFQTVFCFRSTGQENELETVIKRISLMIGIRNFEDWLVIKFHNLFFIYPPISNIKKSQIALASTLAKATGFDFDLSIYKKGYETPWKIGEFSLEMSIPFTVDGVLYETKYGFDKPVMLKPNYRSKIRKQKLYELFLRTYIGYASQW